jgi:hypothetical protein
MEEREGMRWDEPLKTNPVYGPARLYGLVFCQDKTNRKTKMIGVNCDEVLMFLK